MASCSTSVIAPNTINRLEFAVFSPMAMLAGMQLDVFTPLKDGPLTGAQIASAIGVSATKLQPLLHALVAAELLVVQDDRFSNTPEAGTYLVRGSPAYLGSRQEMYADTWQALLKTGATIRAGAPQHKHDFYAMSETEMGAFFRPSHPYAVADGEHIAKIMDFSRFRNLLDVGGGSGGFSVGVCRSCPGLTATVVDLAKVLPLTRQFVVESGMADRVSTAVTDVIAEAPGGSYDVAVMRALVQVLSLENAQAAVRNVARSLRPGGTILLLGFTLDDSRQSPAGLVGQNLVLLNVYDDGLIYTVGEYRGLLAEAGFVDIEVRPQCMLGGHSLVAARKPE